MEGSNNLPKEAPGMRRGASARFGEGGAWEAFGDINLNGAASAAEGFAAAAKKDEETPDYGNVEPASAEAIDININTSNVHPGYKPDDVLTAEAMQMLEDSGGILEDKIAAQSELDEALSGVKTDEDGYVPATPQEEIVGPSKADAVADIGAALDERGPTDFEDEGPNGEEADDEAVLRVLDTMSRSRKAVEGSSASEPVVLSEDQIVEAPEEPFKAEVVPLEDIVPDQIVQPDSEGKEVTEKSIRKDFPNVFGRESKINSTPPVETAAAEQVEMKAMPEIDAELLELGQNESVEFSVVGMGELLSSLHQKRQELVAELFDGRGSLNRAEFDDVFDSVVNEILDLQKLFEDNWSTKELREHTRTLNWEMSLFANLVNVLREEKSFADRGLTFDEEGRAVVEEGADLSPEEMLMLAIEESSTFEDLYQLIQEIEGLEGEGGEEGEYDAETLISLIEAYREGRVELDSVPGMFALDVKVQELKDQEAVVREESKRVEAERRVAFDKEMDQILEWESDLRGKAQSVDVLKTDSANRATFRSAVAELAQQVETHQLGGAELTDEEFSAAHENIRKLHETIVTHEESLGEETASERLSTKAELVADARQNLEVWEGELDASRASIEDYVHYKAHERVHLGRKIAKLNELLNSDEVTSVSDPTSLYERIQSKLSEIEADKAAIIEAESSSEDIFAQAKENIAQDENELKALDALQEEMRGGIDELEDVTKALEADFANATESVTDTDELAALQAKIGNKINLLKMRTERLNSIAESAHEDGRTAEEIDTDFDKKFDSLKNLIAEIDVDLGGYSSAGELADEPAEIPQAYSPETKLPNVEKTEAQTPQEVLQKAFLRIGATGDDAEWVGSWWGKRGARDEELRDFMRVKREDNKFKKLIQELKTQAGAFAPQEKEQMLVGEYVNLLAEGVAKAQRTSATRLRQDVVAKSGISE